MLDKLLKAENNYNMKTNIEETKVRGMTRKERNILTI